eukprot:TRINITY_DN2528_c0_g1_i16.p1 TRINITY_DN2528_c0_g1~~TRINITY_DN2528_c0_g1_i16.p1  ORF type:complete len:450 (+),score=73.33 TRINITY_DN2528_c0_g1_i16:135-1484(+)
MRAIRAAPSQSSLRGKLLQLKDRLDRYQTDNTDFIVLRAGLSRFRTLRCFLIAPDFSNACVYDIIVPKAIKETMASRRQEEVRRFKADLGALSEEEKEAMCRDKEIEEEFVSNPFFYREMEDLMVDLNFKNYLKTEFNVAFVDVDLVVDQFVDIEEKTKEIYIACIKSNDDKPMIKRAIEKIQQNLKSPNVFYTTYKNVLDAQMVPLYLENFAETGEFFEGLDSSIRQKCKVSPLRTKAVSKDPNTITLADKKLNREIIFAKSLNKKPLRKFSPKQMLTGTRSFTILPALPQRYVIDKQYCKIPSLRNVIHAYYNSSSMMSTSIRCYKRSRARARPWRRRSARCRSLCGSSRTSCESSGPTRQFRPQLHARAGSRRRSCPTKAPSLIPAQAFPHRPPLAARSRAGSNSTMSPAKCSRIRLSRLISCFNEPVHTMRGQRTGTSKCLSSRN